MRLIKYCIQILLMFNCITQLIAAPIVASISPTNGNVAGGNVITISGSGFTGASNVDFATVPATSFIVNSDTSISAVVPPGVPGTVDVTVTVAAQTSPFTRADFYTYTQIGWRGIISGIAQNELRLFNTATNTIDSTIPLASASPAVIITPDGKRFYTANTDGTVTVLDVATQTVIAIIATGAGPGGFDIIVNPAGTRIYVSNINSGIVSVIDALTNSFITNILVAPQLGPLSITPDGATVYVVSFANGTVTPIDTATNTVGTAIPTGITPGMISITPDGTKAFVSNLNSDTVSVIDIATNTVINTINLPAGSGPYGSSIIPLGTTLYVANLNNDTVTVIDVASETIITTIPLVPGSQPFWVVTTPDSKTVYVLNEITDDVTPIDVATNIAGPNFATGMLQVQDIVMSPDPAPVATFTAIAAPVGLPTTFDASASISPIGTIALYAWDFDDGTIITTTSPLINHTYVTTGNFNVRLTVTNSAGTSITQVFSSRFMSNNGSGIATVTHLVVIAPLPPINVQGFQQACRYPTQTDIINVITFNPPLSAQLPASYRIYRDVALTDLIAIIPDTGPFIFEDHNRKINTIYTYFIVSVDQIGILSTPVLITIP